MEVIVLYLKMVVQEIFILKDLIKVHLQSAGGEDGVKVISDGAVELFHNGTKKFETTGYGVTVAGEMHATQYYGDGSKLTGVAAAGSGGGALDITSCLFI